jgi:Tfp pilus assembly protein PilV
MLVKDQISRQLRMSSSRFKQTGATLMEAMISLALSLVVTLAMITLMGNSMGSANRIMQMSQLTGELRNAMSMMSRDIRRANYSASSIYCYGNADCGVDGSAAQAADISIAASDDCFIFGLDRNWDGDSSTDDAGAFRRIVTSGVGAIEIWVGDDSPDCDTADADWIALTDPDIVDITTLFIDDSSSFQNSITGSTGTITQRTRKIQMQIEGRLILDNSITRRIEDTIKVRNDFWL